MSQAKAGESVSAKAMAKLRKFHPRIFSRLTTKESTTIASKTDAKQGQWICVDCGQIMANNFEADTHEKYESPRHRLAWWNPIAERFEEP